MIPIITEFDKAYKLVEIKIANGWYILKSGEKLVTTRDVPCSHGKYQFIPKNKIVTINYAWANSLGVYVNIQYRNEDFDVDAEQLIYDPEKTRSMKNTLKLYVETMFQEHWIPFTLFAQLGAKNNDVEVIKFYDINKVPTHKYNMICGCVEVVEEYLTRLGVEVPKPIDMIEFSKHSEYVGREIWLDKLENCNNYNQDLFIKPYHKTKQFTPFSHKSKDDYLMYSQDIEDHGIEVLFQEHVNILSEWRVYITKGKIIKVCNYAGDSLIFPDAADINQIKQDVEKAGLDTKGYTIDIGVDDNLHTFVVELQDGYSIGNYGLTPEEYFTFLKSRWLELVN